MVTKLSPGRAKCPLRGKIAPAEHSGYKREEQVRGSIEPAGGAHEPGESLRLRGQGRRDPSTGLLLELLGGQGASRVDRLVCLLVSNLSVAASRARELKYNLLRGCTLAIVHLLCKALSR